MVGVEGELGDRHGSSSVSSIPQLVRTLMVSQEGRDWRGMEKEKNTAKELAPLSLTHRWAHSLTYETAGRQLFVSFLPFAVIARFPIGISTGAGGTCGRIE